MQRRRRGGPLLAFLLWAASAAALAAAAENEGNVTRGGNATGKPEPLPLILPAGLVPPGGGSSAGAAQQQLEARQRADNGALVACSAGLELLSSLECVAPVVVIGPYRSGKSFTLNQLLQVDCEHGFGVGHTRQTQTRGVWVWGEPRPVTLPDGSTCSVVYVDTEGFESAGRSNAYDDRIFALSTLLSSVLIYNLPEAVRESDIAKLSFSVQLAEGLFSQQQQHHHHQQQPGRSAAEQQGAGDGGQQDSVGLSGSFEPGAMIWLIQRDFLQGSGGAQQAVKEALALVPNPTGNPEVEALNRVRSSLGALAASSQGFSMPQPHLERARLCELPDEQLDGKYRAARDALRGKVLALAKPKMVGGRRATGKALAGLLTELVEGLNQQEIPSVANLLDAFNRQRVQRAVKQFRRALEAVPLPAEEPALRRRAGAARGEVQGALRAALLGNDAGHQQLLTELSEALDREVQVRLTENQASSSSVCGKLEAECEAQLDAAMTERLPSLHRFAVLATRCESRFNGSCAGPARPAFWQRLQRSRAKAEAQFNTEYNGRLHTGLTLLCLVAGVTFRWIFRARVLEALGWIGFAVLELSPHLLLGGAKQMYQSAWWVATSHAWEGCVRLLRLDGGWTPLVWLGMLCAAWFWRWRRRRSGAAGAAAAGRGRGPKQRALLDV